MGIETGFSAYLDKNTGEIYYDSDEFEKELPEDLYECNQYIELPSKREFGLGKPLALSFAASYLASDFDLVQSFFNARGAYSKFKTLLERKNKLDDWYAYEQEAVKSAIVKWCKDNDVDVAQ